MKLKIGVIFGGESVEHEVSIISAVQAMKSLDKEKYDIVPIYITKEREWYTGKMLMNLEVYREMYNIKKYAKNVVLYNKDDLFILQNKKGLKNIVDCVDLILPIVHGANVEDGTLAGYLELIGVPYCEGNLYASVVGQDKVFMKQIFKSENIPVVKYEWFFDSEYIDDPESIKKRINKLGYPVIVKPAKLGSSIGIDRAKNEDELEKAIEEAIKYDNKILVEKCVENLLEVNCSGLGTYEYVETSEIEEVMGKDEFLSYQDKYIGTKKGSSKGMVSAHRVIPARIDSKLSDEVKDLTKKVFRILNASGVVRVDYLLDKKSNKIYVNEINTIPGSMSFYLWDKTNKTYSQLLDEVINIAINNYKKRNQKTYSFNSNILENFNGSKGKLKK
ncbi:MAG: D-alanine--D-alanine ligase [Bacilli bacterium]|nr:D-alanine--D-alanine ligase [Bacilli bacterium]